MVEAAFVLFLGFVLGMQHALDPDHVIAVLGMSTNSKSAKKSLTRGVLWGLGHTATLLLVGVGVLFFSLAIPDFFANVMEAVVGLIVFVIGLSVLMELWKNRIHIHAHQHGGVDHAHFHGHRNLQNHSHPHDRNVLLKPLAVGAVHGLAGSAFLMLFVFSTIESAVAGLMYILLFGMGSIIGMSIISGVISAPFIFTEKIYNKLNIWLKMSVGLGSIVFGIFYSTHAFIGLGLIL